jgi:V8-like Glu-specific endopeptidase
MASKAVVTVENGAQHEDEALFGNKPSGAQAQNSTTATVDEVQESAGTETEAPSDGSESGAEADNASDHVSLSSPVRAVGSSTPSEATESGEETDPETFFEEVEGVDESALLRMESDAGEALIEAAYAAEYADGESGEEFFAFAGAFLLPLLKSFIPVITQAIAKEGLSKLSPQLRSIMQKLARFGVKIPVPTGKESANGDAEALELDEATLEALAQQLEALEVIIDKDDRVQIKNTTAIPWRRICHLNIRTATGKSYLGTGFLIGPRTIITAGHCVYIHSQGGWAQQIVVSPGRNGTQTPFTPQTATMFRSVRGWVNGKKRNYDYGAIILPRTVSYANVGAFGFANLADSALLNKRINTAGYPGDKAPGTMWYNANKVTGVTARTITYLNDTMPGQSGSPVWLRRADGSRVVVGIHTNGASSGNSATRINKAVFENLKRWRNEGGLS